MQKVDQARKAAERSRKELQEKEQALKIIYDEIAKELCPFNIGDVIEYEPGKKGMVEEIFFSGECWRPLEDQEPNVWAVRGRKIKKDGSFRKKNFQPVVNTTHVIDGNVCRHKTLNETLGIE